jgi:hypothetical protein
MHRQHDVEYLRSIVDAARAELYKHPDGTRLRISIDAAGVQRLEEMADHIERLERIVDTMPKADPWKALERIGRI